jgi:hypothetical protein
MTWSSGIQYFRNTETLCAKPSASQPLPLDYEHAGGKRDRSESPPVALLEARQQVLEASPRGLPPSPCWRPARESRRCCAAAGDGRATAAAAGGARGSGRVA